MKMLVFLIVFLATPAMAQQPFREYTLKLPADMINQIGVALDELPGHVRHPITEAIIKQVNEQNAEFAKQDAAKKQQEKPTIDQKYLDDVKKHTDANGHPVSPK